MPKAVGRGYEKLLIKGRANSLEKTLMLKRLRAGGGGETEDEMVE